MTDPTKLAREALDELRSVLCNPEGRCCIYGTRADREIVDKALDKIATLSTAPGERAALREAVERVILRRLHKNRIDGYTLEMAEEIAALSTAPGESEGARTSLTAAQKLQALAHRYYGFGAWEPKPGDYYTTARADLELYQIVDVRDGKVFTQYCDPARGSAVSEWPQEEFLSPETFGRVRVHVPEWVLSSNPPAAPAGEAGMRTAILAEAVRACWSVPLFTGALNNRSGAIIKQDCIDAIRALAQETSNG